MECLNLEELKALIGTGKKIRFHPDYSGKAYEGEFEVEKIEPYEDGFWVYFGETGKIIRKDGKGIGSNSPMFILANSKAQSSPVPRNNDGRTICFWCNVPTQLRGGGMYNVCPKCGQ